MTAAAPAGFVEIEALARACRSPRLDAHDRHCARSLIDQWSRQATAGPRATPIPLTRRQLAMAAVLARKAGSAPGPGRGAYVLEKAPERRWFLDTSPHRQACRGRKSGMTRRYATRDRDAKIARWINRGRHGVRQVAKHVGLSIGAVSAIASRARGGKGYWRGPEKYHPPDTRRRRLFSLPSWKAPRAFNPASHASRNSSIFSSLTAWTALNTVRKLPDRVVLHEAERLNCELIRPLRPAEIRRVVRSVCRRRSRFAEHP